MNWIQLSTINGRHYRFNSGADVEYVCFDTMSLKKCKAIDAKGKYLAIVRRIETDGTVTEVDGIPLDFDTGYALGLVATMCYFFDENPGKFVGAFRDTDTLFPLLDYLGPYGVSHRAIRHSIGANIRDEELVKSEIDCPKFVSLMKYFGLGRKTAVDHRFMDHVPQSFKEGLFVGLFDSRAGVYYHTREKHGRNPYYLCQIDVSNARLYRLAIQIVDAVDIEYKEYFSHHKGQNRNRISFQLDSVMRHRGLFDRVSYWKLREGLDDLFDGPSRGSCSFSKFPINEEIYDKVKMATGVSMKIRCTKRYTPVVSREEAGDLIKNYMLKENHDETVAHWARMHRPNVRFDMVKSISTKLCGRSNRYPNLRSALSGEYPLLS